MARTRPPWERMTMGRSINPRETARPTFPWALPPSMQVTTPFRMCSISGSWTGIQRGGRDGHVPEPHGGNLRHDHIENLVSLPEMVMKGDGHPVLEFDPLDRLPKGGDHVVLAGMQYGAEPRPDAPLVLFGRFGKRAGKGTVTPAVDFQGHFPPDGIDGLIVLPTCGSSPYPSASGIGRPSRSAMRMIFSALWMIGLSIIFPLTTATPLPFLAGDFRSPDHVDGMLDLRFRGGKNLVNDFDLGRVNRRAAVKSHLLDRPGYLDAAPPHR